MVRTKNN